MSSGQPNWQQLADMGKLPKEHRDKVPYLSQIDSLQALANELEAKVNLAYSLFTPEQKRAYNMTLKGEDPNKNSIEEE